MYYAIKDPLKLKIAFGNLLKTAKGRNVLCHVL